MGFFSKIAKGVGGLLGGGAQQGGSAQPIAVPRQQLQTLGGTSFVDQRAGTAGLTGSPLSGIFQQQLGNAARTGNNTQSRNALQDLLGLAGSEGARARGITPESEFAQIQALLAPGQEQDRADLESRLFSQGRLGGTGGSNEQQALRTAQGQVLQQGAQEAVASSRQARESALASALGLTQAGAGGLQGLNTGALQNALGINESQLQQILGAQSVSQTTTPVSRGGGSSALGGLAGGLAGSFFGPVGTAAGGALGKRLFS